MFSNDVGWLANCMQAWCVSALYSPSHLLLSCHQENDSRVGLYDDSATPPLQSVQSHAHTIILAVTPLYTITR